VCGRRLARVSATSAVSACASTSDALRSAAPRAPVSAGATVLLGRLLVCSCGQSELVGDLAVNAFVVVGVLAASGQNATLRV
jgi:hypothetical protein